MDYIEAKGYKNGKKINTMIAIESSEYFVTVSDNSYYAELEGLLESEIIVGGTYPAPEHSLLKAYYVLERFYEYMTESDIHGTIEEIPYEPGVIY